MALSALYYPPSHVTVEEYLKFEECSETKNEYADGKIITMSGTSLPHNEVIGNVYAQMKIAFSGRICRAYFADIRVKVSATRYRYPDVIALCGRPETEDTNPPSLLNPQVLVEVLSPSTERIDLITKLGEYSGLASITDYIIIAQDRWWVMHYSRENGGTWTAVFYTQPSDTLNITSINVRMTLAAIYNGVELSAEPAEEGDKEPGEA